MRIYFLLAFILNILVVNAQVFNGTGGFIPTFSWASFNLGVSNVGVIDCDLKVCLDITHDFDDDLQIRLISPQGTIVNLSFNNGGYGNNYTNTCFTMDATTNVSVGTAPFNGDYIPEGNLSNLIGQNANGNWILQVRDDVNLDDGTLNNWSIDFTCPEPCTDNIINLSFLTDYYPEETSWSIVDASNQILYSDSYTYLEYESTFDYEFCLESGCYDFIINDSYGDGLIGIYSNYSFDDGDYEITDASGNTLVEMGNADFEDQSIHGFCVGSSGCTDPLACNYDSDVEDDDGSCYYSPLEINLCENLYCGYQSGEQSTSNVSIEYLIIPITEAGTLNELYYNINWHNQGFISGGVPGPYSTITIKLYDDNNLLVQTLQNLYNPNATPAYLNFESTDSYDLSVQDGFYIAIEANSFFGWTSYINLAEVSFTISNESINAGDNLALDLCYDDFNVNLYDYLGIDVDTDGTWSPALPGGYLGNLNPQNNASSGIYTYTVSGECLTDESFVDVSITEISVPQINASIDSVCEGTSSVIYSVVPNPGCTYSWYVNGGQIIGQVSANSIEVDWSMISQGLINDAVVLTEYFNSCDNSISIDVPIIANPVVDLTIDDNEICLGESVNVNANGGYDNYEWTPSEISSNSDIFTPLSSSDNQISLTITGDAACVSTEIINFTIYDLPIVNLSTDDSDICMGDSMILSSTAGYTNYSWTPASISGSSAVYFPSSSSESEISLLITGDGGCTSFESLDISVFDLPIVNLSVDDSEICIGETINLNTTAGYNNYDWTPSSITSSTDTYTPISLTDNEIAVTITADGGCLASDSLTLTIYDLPIVNLSTDDSDICMGDSMILSSTAGYTNYSWTPASISGSSAVYFPSSSSESEISLLITGDGGCTSFESLDISVFDLPIVNLSVDDSEICIGETINLNTTFGYNNYDWTPSSITSSTDTYTPISLTDNKIALTITGDGGCVSSDSIVLVINPLPIVEVSLSDSVICLGESIVVNSTAGFVNYNWIPSIINTGNLITPLLSETNYFVEVTDDKGCVSSDDAYLTINESSPIELDVNGSNTTKICIGEEIDLLATPGFITYNWFPTNFIINQGSYTPTDLTDTQYSITGTNEFGCFSTASLNIIINSIPDPSPISVFKDNSSTTPQSINLCENISNVKFSALASSDSNPVEWIFESGSGAIFESNKNSSEVEVSFPVVEDYVLEFREYGSVNCYTTQQIKIKVNPNPIINMSYVEDCYKDSIYLTNNSIVDTAIQSVSWLVEGLSFGTYNLTYPLENKSKIFELTVVDVLNCYSSLSTSFVPSERPNVDFYYNPEKISILNPEVSFVNLTTNSSNVSWTFGDNQSSVTWNPIHTYDSIGWYEVILKAENEVGCKDSISKQLLVENDFIIYFPTSFTPDGDGLNDDFGIDGFRLDNYQEFYFEIINRWGDKLFYTNDINERWNGKTPQGNDAILGNYLWSVRLVDSFGKIKRKFGEVIITR